MKRLIIGISGASGAIFGIRLLQFLKERTEIETHLVITQPAERTIVQETHYRPQEVKSFAGVVHSISDIGACISSGSFKTMGMVVIPCSMRTASAIAFSISDNLLTRAADVVLKEGRKLVAVVRESPLHLGHLKNLVALAEMGAIIMPPVPAFYALPKTLEDIIDHTIGRILDHFDIEHNLVKRWGEQP